MWSSLMRIYLSLWGVFANSRNVNDEISNGILCVLWRAGEQECPYHLSAVVVIVVIVIAIVVTVNVHKCVFIRIFSWLFSTSLACDVTLWESRKFFYFHFREISTETPACTCIHIKHTTQIQAQWQRTEKSMAIETNGISWILYRRDTKSSAFICIKLQARWVPLQLESFLFFRVCACVCKLS